MKTVQEKSRMSLKSFDLLHVPINLCLKNEPFIKTKIGASLSIILVLLNLLFAWLIGKDIIFKERPFSFQQINILKSFSGIKLNRTSFPLAVSILDFDGTPLDYKGYFTLSMKSAHYKADQEGILKKKDAFYFQLKKCEYSDFPQFDKNRFDFFGLKHALCPDNYNEEIFGFWTTPELRYIEINLNTCNPEQDENCKNKTEIENFITEKGASLSLHFLETQISVDNYSQPVSKIIKSPYVFAQPGIFKLQNFLIQNDRIETDEGIFTESKKYDYFLQIKEEHLDSTGYDDNLKSLINFNIYSSNKYTLTTRKYIKCTEILASIGGVYKLLFSFFYSLNFYFADLEKDLMVIDALNYLTDNENSSDKKIEKIDFNSSKLHLNNVNLNTSSKLCQHSSFNSQILKITNCNKVLDDDPNFKRFNDKFLTLIKEEREINSNARKRRISPSPKLTPVKSKKFESQTNTPRILSEQKRSNVNNDSPPKLNENITKNLCQTPVKKIKILPNFNFNNLKDDFTIPYSSKSSKNVLSFKHTNISLLEKIKIIISNLFNYQSTKEQKINKYLTNKIEIKSRLDVVNIIFQLNEIEKIKNLVM
jgi:hypothetical protein